MGVIGSSTIVTVSYLGDSQEQQQARYQATSDDCISNFASCRQSKTASVDGVEKSLNSTSMITT